MAFENSGALYKVQEHGVKIGGHVEDKGDSRRAGFHAFIHRDDGAK